MFAIGFLLFVFGLLIMQIFGTGKIRTFNRADNLAIPMIAIGFILMMISLAIFMWRWLP